MIEVEGPRLSAEDLSVERGDCLLLGGLALSLRPGEALELVGPNGSGKTTLLRILAGLLQPDTGEVRWRGRAIREQRSEYHQEMHWLGHLDAIKLELSAYENLRLTGLSAATCLKTLARFDLHQRAEVEAQKLSAGQRRRLALGWLWAWPRSLWLLDEPFTALDRSGRELLLALIEEHREQGGMLIYSSHHDERVPNAARLELLLPSRVAAPDPAASL